VTGSEVLVSGSIVMPAQAGIQRGSVHLQRPLGSRLRGNDDGPLNRNRKQKKSSGPQRAARYSNGGAIGWRVSLWIGPGRVGVGRGLEDQFQPHSASYFVARSGRFISVG